MSWDLSSEEVICNKLESQQTTIFAFSKKIKILEHELKYAETLITEVQADKFEARAIIKELEAKLQVAVEALEEANVHCSRGSYTDKIVNEALKKIKAK